MKTIEETEEVKDEVMETNKIDYKRVGSIIDDILLSFAKTYGNGRNEDLPKEINGNPIYTMLASIRVVHCDDDLVKFIDLNGDFLGIFSVMTGTYHTDYGSRNIIAHHKFNMINSFCNMLAKEVKRKMTYLPQEKKKFCIAYPKSEESLHNLDEELPPVTKTTEPKRFRYGMSIEQLESFDRTMLFKQYFSTPDFHLLYDMDGSVAGYEISKKSKTVKEIMSRRSSDPGYHYKLEHGLVASNQMILNTATDICSSIIGEDLNRIKLSRRQRSFIYSHTRGKHISFETDPDNYSATCLYVLNSISHKYDIRDHIYRNISMFKNMLGSDMVWNEFMGISILDEMDLDFVDHLSDDILDKLISTYDDLNVDRTYDVYEPESLKAVIKMMIVYINYTDYNCHFHTIGRPNLTNVIVDYFINENISLFSLVKSKIDNDKQYRMTSESSEYFEAICKVIISVYGNFKDVYK